MIMSETFTVIERQPNAIKEVSKNCRMCLKNSGDFISLDSYFEASSDECSYWDAYNFCTNLNAQQTDGLPNIICLECTENLRFVFQVLRKAIHSEEILKRILEKQLLEEQEYEEFSEDQIVSDEVIYENDEPKDNEPVEYNSMEEYLLVDDDAKQTEDKEASNLDDFECSICNCVFLDKIDLLRHIDTHNVIQKEASEHVEEDGEEATNESTENTDLLHTELEIKDENSQKKERKPSERVFMCEICAKIFSTKQKFKMHTFVHTKEKNFDCKLCPKRFTTVFKQREHMRNHANIRKHECTVCDQKFFSKHTLVCHMRRHTGERPYKCVICGKSFSQSSILKTHFALHQGKTTQCPHCPKKFSRPSHLILHQRSHTGERPYACNHCPNSYKQKSHLDRHIDTHMGVKFTCEICGKEYTKKSSLKNHMYVHSDIKPFKCLVCLKDFPSKDRFRRHMRNTHKTEAKFDSPGSDDSMIEEPSPE